MAAHLFEVRSLGRSGLDLLTLSSSHFDPTETCAPQDCCDAERVDIKKDYGGKIVRNANGATPLPSIRYLIA